MCVCVWSSFCVFSPQFYWWQLSLKQKQNTPPQRISPSKRICPMSASVNFINEFIAHMCSMQFDREKERRRKREQKKPRILWIISIVVFFLRYRAELLIGVLKIISVRFHTVYTYSHNQYNSLSVHPKRVCVKERERVFFRSIGRFCCCYCVTGIYYKMYAHIKLNAFQQVMLLACTFFNFCHFV